MNGYVSGEASLPYSVLPPCFLKEEMTPVMLAGLAISTV